MAKGKVATPQEKRLTILRGFQFVVYAWALRLSFVAIGGVLVSVFQLFVPTTTIGIKLQHIPLFTWKSTVEDEYRVMSLLKEPVLFTDVNVIPPTLLRSKMERVTPILTTPLKSSSSPEFVHYARDRLWSSEYSDVRTYEYISVDKYLHSAVDAYHPYGLLDHLRSNQPSTHSKTCINNVNNQCIQSQNEQAKFVYGTHSNALSYMQALSPGFAQYLSLQDDTPQVCMWVSSPEVAAAMHYDLDDNYLLQISGIKKIILVSPEALPALQPYTSYHPHWRQAHNSSHLYTSTQVITRLRDYVDNSTNSIVHTSSVFGEMKVWEVTLVPGSMVFIPAGYYHTIITGVDSLTVNAWFTSEMSTLYTVLSNVPLPYSKANTIEENINNVAVLVRTLLRQLRTVGLSVDLFVEVFTQRFEALRQSGTWRVHDKNMLCSQEDVRHLESILVEDSSIARTADKIHSLFTTTQLSTALLTLTLSDYLEEVLRLIWGDTNITPSLLHDFTTQCVGLHEPALVE